MWVWVRVHACALTLRTSSNNGPQSGRKVKSSRNFQKEHPEKQYSEMLAIISHYFQIHLCKIYKYKMESIFRSFTEWCYFIFRDIFSLFFFQQPGFPLYKSIPLFFSSLYFLLNDEKADSHFNPHFSLLSRQWNSWFFSEQMSVQGKSPVHNCPLLSSVILRLILDNGMWAEMVGQILGTVLKRLLEITVCSILLVGFS